METQNQASRVSNEPTLEDQLKQYEKMLNVLTHDDWREMYLFFAERAYSFQQEMDNAPNWEQFIVARALRRYTADYLMHLPGLIKSTKEEIERRIVERDVANPELPEYEQD